MQVIGLLGGVASGKSLVANQMAALGAIVVDADSLGHQVLGLPHVEAAVRARWGSGVFGLDGRVCRPALAKIVFAPGAEGTKQRHYLEQITHPEIRGRVEQLIKQAAAEGRIAVLDAALLLEAGWAEQCTSFVFVDVPRAVRLDRALARGWSEEEFAAREAAQASLEVKRARADWVVNNSASPEATRAQVEQFWRGLKG